MRYRYRKVYGWSSDLAYCVGLLATDGSLSSDGRHIDLTSKDMELLEIFRTTLAPAAKIGAKRNGSGGVSFRVQVGNTALFDFLASIGLTPKKSKTLGALRIPDSYYADFLRGCFDGDGTVFAYQDKRWQKSYMYYVGYTSASYAFIAWLCENNNRLAEVTALKPRFSSRAWKIHYAKRDSRLLFDFMYYGDDLQKLTRKYNAFKNFLSSDPYVKIAVDARVLESVDRHA